MASIVEQFMKEGVLEFSTSESKVDDVECWLFTLKHVNQRGVPVWTRVEIAKDLRVTFKEMAQVIDSQVRSDWKNT